MADKLYCRICLEESGGVLTSIYTTEFAMVPSEMIMLCAKVKIYKDDGMPGLICNNCIYRLGVAYHFKQQCENSDLRLRQYFGLMDRAFSMRDCETNTEEPYPEKSDKGDDEDGGPLDKRKNKYKSKPSRYKRKSPEERKKRGPKPTPKVAQTCYECNKTFKCAAQLQMHIRCHSGERPFACNYCSRRFAQKHNLIIHVRIHTGEKPFQCEVCNKSFRALGNFHQHRKIHAGIRDQICPVCNKAFISGGDLSRHITTHTGIKNHHCDTCGKSFTRNRDMVAHKKKIHLKDPESQTVKCPDCKKVFATTESMNEHFRTVHSEAPQPVQMIPNHPQSHHGQPQPALRATPPPVTHNQPGSIDHLLNSTPIHPAPISHAPISHTPGGASSSLHILQPAGLGMLPSHSQAHLGMLHPY